MRRRHPFAVVVLLALVAAACTDAPASTTTTASPAAAPQTTTTTVIDTTSSSVVEGAVDASVGAAGIGDEYYPTLGNGGYDVSHYDLDLGFNPDANVLGGTATIEATATQSLTSFNLDFDGFEISELTVNNRTAEFERVDRELVITPPFPLMAGELFRIAVTYSGSPGAVESIAFPRVSMGWREGPDGERYVVAEPDAANSWFPAMIGTSSSRNALVLKKRKI